MAIPTTARINAWVQNTAPRNGRERDRHDLGREDEVRLDRARDLLVLERLRAQRDAAELRFMRVRVMRHEDLENLLGAFVAKIRSADHQQRRDAPGQQIAERERRGQKDQQLVAQRSEGDLRDDRHLALGGETHHVARRHGGVVDHHPGGLHAGLGGLRRHIVKRGCRHAGDRRNVVEQGQQSDTHKRSPSGHPFNLAAFDEPNVTVVLRAGAGIRRTLRRSSVCLQSGGFRKACIARDLALHMRVEFARRHRHQLDAER